MPAMPRTQVELKNPNLAALLAWLVPGLGHFYQGRKAKGVLYSTCILGLFALGLYLGEGNVVFWRWVNPMNDPEQFRLPFLGQFFSGLPGLLGLIQATLKHWGMGPILWGWMAEPPMAVINGMHPRLGKLVEVGMVYTAIAGLLNIFAIYDAYDGPAYQDEPASEPAAAAAAAVPSPATDGLKVGEPA
jgi:hypothetical protein